MQEVIKRVFDIAFSLICLILLFPLMAVVAVIIKLESRGGALFKQERVGQNFKPIRLYKYRSMVADAPEKGLPMTVGNDPRITSVGRFLRKTKIDELPQLFNVLKGDMSIVGPRPEVLRYVEMFKDDYREILQVRPGLTDYAAIEYRNEEEVLKKYRYAEEGYINEVLPAKIVLYKRYLRDKSLLIDLSIIGKTLIVIITQ